jgi:hypothetical protein
MDSLGKCNGAFGKMGVATGEVEVLLVVGGYDVRYGNRAYQHVY